MNVTNCHKILDIFMHFVVAVVLVPFSIPSKEASRCHNASSSSRGVSPCRQTGIIINWVHGRGTGDDARWWW